MRFLDGSSVDWFLWLAIGAVMGLLKTFARRQKSLRQRLLDVGAGIAGAVPAAWFMLPFSSVTDPDQLHLAGLTGALFGAFLLLAVLEAFRRECSGREMSGASPTTRPGGGASILSRAAGPQSTWIGQRMVIRRSCTRPQECARSCQPWPRRPFADPRMRSVHQLIGRPGNALVCARGPASGHSPSSVGGLHPVRSRQWRRTALPASDLLPCVIGK